MNTSRLPNNDSESQPSAEPSSSDAPKTFDFDEMSEGGNLVLIQFNGVSYRLQRTRNQRLILQK